MPEVGLEPTRGRASGDFESPASTNFTTPALSSIIIKKRQRINEKVKFFHVGIYSFDRSSIVLRIWTIILIRRYMRPGTWE